ncbi:MAG: 16S rRNA (uracil(1498)-N(3))-methyltransferase [Pseudomonadota bacterium]
MAGKTVARLFVAAQLREGANVTLTRDQSHYLGNVLRLAAGDDVLLFNGADGEWQATLKLQSKKVMQAVCEALTRPQSWPAPITYAFAPLKHARLDYIAQKASELGVARVTPVITEHTISRKLNMDRLRSNLIEGSEQCGVLWVPNIEPAVALDTFLRQLRGDETLVFCDEAAESNTPLDALSSIGPGPVTVLIGPEGGFSLGEQARIRAHSAAVPISLGPRIMRADTAAVAALALVQSVLGDWRPAV